MAGASFPEAVVGLLLVFFVPGYTWTRATFPEWRLRGAEALLRLLETLTLSIVLSVVLTVLAGYALLAAAPGGFQAYWTDPVLESLLGALAAVGFAVGWFRGAYRREPPLSARPAVPDLGEEGAWELTRELDRLQRSERRLQHRIRTEPSEGPARAESERELTNVREQLAELQRQREAAYAR